MRILILDDEKNVALATIKTMRDFEFTYVDNLIDFNEFIYMDLQKSPNDRFDYYIVDLQIDLGILTLEEYSELIPNMFTTESTVIDDDIYLYGWDYFKNIIWPNDKFMDDRTERFVLLTGHLEILKRKKIIDLCPGVQAVKKQGEGVVQKLLGILKEKR